MNSLFWVPLRYWETLRRLKAKQIIHRVLRHIPRRDANYLGLLPQRTRQSPPVAWARKPIRLTGPQTFRFLNEDGDLAEIGWDGPARSKLWRYNQHYFEDLVAYQAPTRKQWHSALIARWISENPPGRTTAWEPYPVSLRIVNWIKWAVTEGNQLTDEALVSLAEQAEWLRARLEWHLLGNHLFSNAKALVFAGLFFEGQIAERWMARGFDILFQEMREQILGDGGQFERTPMYHALALEDILDLINMLRVYGDAFEGRSALTPEFCAYAQTMLLWLQKMIHPDGEISFFNDAAFAIAATPDELERFAAALDIQVSGDPAMPIVHLAESGYVRLENESAVVICDVAPVGPDYLPGHAHADSLSFEFSMGSERVIVNSGTSEYGAGPERLRQRGTAAHSTVIVDERDSSDVWGGFRVGRRAVTRTLGLDDDGGVLRLVAEHDGYARQPVHCVHQREWTLASDSLTISDMLSNPDVRATAHFHIHPDTVVKMDGPSHGHLITATGRTLTWKSDSGGVKILKSSWHPEFGVATPTRCLAVPVEQGQAELRFDWA